MSVVSRRTAIVPTEKPLDKNGLDELISISKYAVDMLLDYSSEEDSYFIYAKYHGGQIIRQVYTQRNSPRKFKDIERAIKWGASMGFRTMSLQIDYSEF